MITCLSSFTENSSNSIVPPSALKVFTSGLRCVLLIYNDNHIRTLKFDDIATAVRENKTFQKAYNYTIEESASEIHSIVSSSINTFGLLDDGRIFYFVSFRAVEVIPHLKNIRAICGSEHGFVLIRNSSPTDVLIEFYSDRGSNEMLKKYKKISIGWEGERWQFERDQEKSILQLVRLETPEMKELFGKFMDQEDDEEDQQNTTYSKAVVFSVNCSLFCVFYENAKDVQSPVYSIGTFLAPISNVFVFKSGLMCVVLRSGLVRLVYIQGKDRDLKEESIFLGLEEVISVEAIYEDESLYLSDGNLCSRVSFQVSSSSTTEEERSFSWSVEKIELSGVVGLAFLPAIQVVLALTENYFIYAIQQVKSTAMSDSSIVNENQQVSSDLVDLPEELEGLKAVHGRMLEEGTKTTAINVLLNPELIQESCKVTFSFKYNVDYNDEPTLMDHEFDIFIEFQYKSELEKVFRNGDWRMNVSLMEKEGMKAQRQKTLKLDRKLLDKKRVKLFREYSRKSGIIGADFEVEIRGFLNTAEKLLINLPLRVTYDVRSLVEVAEESLIEEGKWNFTLEMENEELCEKICGILPEIENYNKPTLLRMGQSRLIMSCKDLAVTFHSEDNFMLQLLKKLILLELLNDNDALKITYEPKETVALSELSARHALFGEDDVTRETPFEICRDLRKCKIKLK